MNYEKILQGILDIGEEMIVCGAEVSRVEDSIRRMCMAYGANKDRINVFIITSNIQVTIAAPDGHIITQIRQIIRYDVNFDRLDYLNDLSRYVCEHTPDHIRIQELLRKVMDRPTPGRAMKLLGSVLVAAAFAVFFGGSLRDGISAGIMGIVIVFMEDVMQKRETNQIVYNFIVSVVAGITAILTVTLGLGENENLIMMGGIMLLIPGIAMTNAVRDMLIGDIATGMLRLTNAVLTAAAIACGFALSIILLGGVL